MLESQTIQRKAESERQKSVAVADLQESHSLVAICLFIELRVALKVESVVSVLNWIGRVTIDVWLWLWG